MNPTSKNPEEVPKKMSQISEWSVPSTRTPGQFYTVKLFPNGGTSCTCQWGKSEEARTRCWHVQLVRVLENSEIQECAGLLDTRAALTGSISAQLTLLQACGSLLATEGRFHAAHRCYEVISKYMLALSVQGAVPKEEAAAAASHNPPVPALAVLRQTAPCPQ